MSLKNIYTREVSQSLKASQHQKTEILMQRDINHLPEIVQRYLYYTGAVGREKVSNVYLRANGKIRSNATDGWMNFHYEQCNTFKTPTRVFYIKASKMGIPATGLHLYKNVSASMEIKLAGLFKIVDARGPEMNQSETVTVFNDMCFMAPASLIDKNIKWETIDSLHVKAWYTNKDITISAILTFNQSGKLLNFISYDRYETTDGKVYQNYPWETPIKEYATFNGMRLPSKADVIYKKPTGDFCYLEFNLEEIKYNIK